jgi:hypothetical protein
MMDLSDSRRSRCDGSRAALFSGTSRTSQPSAASLDDATEAGASEIGVVTTVGEFLRGLGEVAPLLRGRQEFLAQDIVLGLAGVLLGELRALEEFLGAALQG